MSNSSALPRYSFLPLQIDRGVQRLIRESLVDSCEDGSRAILWLPALQPKATVVIHNYATRTTRAVAASPMHIALC